MSNVHILALCKPAPSALAKDRALILYRAAAQHRGSVSALLYCKHICTYGEIWHRVSQRTLEPAPHVSAEHARSLRLTSLASECGIRVLFHMSLLSYGINPPTTRAHARTLTCVRVYIYTYTAWQGGALSASRGSERYYKQGSYSKPYGPCYKKNILND